MDILNAILAFSVSMLVFSTMALVVVEIYYRWNRTREKYFAEMINAFFSEMIWKKLHGVDKTGFTPQQLRNDFLSIMTSVSGLVKLDLALANGADDELDSSLEHSKVAAAKSSEAAVLKAAAKAGTNTAKTEITAKAASGSYVSKTTERLTTLEFAQRLARTKVGQLLMKKGEEKAKAIVLDLAAQLNAISAGSSADFRHRSRKASLWASAVIAIALNVDAVYLFQSYTTDQALAERVIERAPAAIEAYETQQARMDALEQQLDDMPAEAAETFKELRQSVEKSKETVQQSATSLKELGVPIGFNYFPYCSPISKIDSGTTNVAGEVIYDETYADSRCEHLFPKQPLSNMEKFKNLGRLLGWLVGMVLAAILIGQGSPFWFQLFQKLSSALQLLKGLSLVKSKTEQAITKAKEDEQYSPQKAVEIYLQTLVSVTDTLDHHLTSTVQLTPEEKSRQAVTKVRTRGLDSES